MNMVRVSAVPLLALLCACAIPSEEAEPDRTGSAAAETRVVGRAESPLALYPATRGGVHGLLRGQLALEDGCLYVIDERGKRRLPIFRSPGTEWDGSQHALSFEGQWFGIGDRVALPGGEINARRDSDQWVKPPPLSCDLSVAWLVTQSR